MRVSVAGCCCRPQCPGWASSRRLLAFLCALNLLFFLDRGVVASNGVNGTAGDHNSNPGLSASFNLSLLEDGLVAALYFAGVMLGAPAFALASAWHSALRLLGCGTALFGLAAIGCSVSQSLAMILVFRFLVGAGSGSLIALGPPLVDDHAPPALCSLWLGLFYLTMPTGVAIGYLVGGAIGSALTWRAAFWVEAGLAAPFALWCWLAPTVDIQKHWGIAAQAAPAPMPQPDPSPLASACADGSTAERANGALPAAEPDSGAAAALGKEASASVGKRGRLRRRLGVLAAAAAAVWADLRQLARHPVCLCVIGGLTCWNGFIGAYGYYGPKAVTELFSIGDPEQADFVFGAVLAATGITGSLAGGALLDAMGSTMRRGMLLGAAGLLAGCALAVLAVTLARTQAAFWPLFAGAEFSVFLVMAPANAVCMWSVPPELRPFALAASEAMQHLLGDIPTPPALGALQGAVDNWRLSLAVFALLLVLGGAFFGIGAVLAHPKRSRDYRQDEQLPVQPHDAAPDEDGADLERHELLGGDGAPGVHPAAGVKHDEPARHVIAANEQPNIPV